MDVYLTNQFPGNTLEKFAKFLIDPPDLQYLDGKGNKEFALARNNEPDVIAQLGIKNFDKNMRIWLLIPDRAFGSIPIYEDDPSLAEWIGYSANDIQNGYVTLKPLKSAKPGSSSTAGAPPPPKRKRYGNSRRHVVLFFAASVFLSSSSRFK